MVTTTDNARSIHYTYFYLDLQSGWTALHIAAMNGNQEVVQLLLQCGADKAAIDNVSRKCICSLCISPNPTCVFQCCVCITFEIMEMRYSYRVG